VFPGLQSVDCLGRAGSVSVNRDAGWQKWAGPRAIDLAKSDHEDLRSAVVRGTPKVELAPSWFPIRPTGGGTFEGRHSQRGNNFFRTRTASARKPVVSAPRLASLLARLPGGRHPPLERGPREWRSRQQARPRMKALALPPSPRARALRHGGPSLEFAFGGKSRQKAAALAAGGKARGHPSQGSRRNDA